MIIYFRASRVTSATQRRGGRGEGRKAFRAIFHSDPQLYHPSTAVSGLEAPLHFAPHRHPACAVRAETASQHSSLCSSPLPANGHGQQCAKQARVARVQCNAGLSASINRCHSVKSIMPPRYLVLLSTSDTRAARRRCNWPTRGPILRPGSAFGRSVMTRLATPRHSPRDELR